MENPFRGPVPVGTRLIETFGHWPGQGIAHLDLHLDRMGRGAELLGFRFDRPAAMARLAGLDGDAGPLRCRLTLGARGDLDLATAPLPETPPRWRVALAADRLTRDDPWLRIKSTQRALYDRARTVLPPGLDEWLFLNDAGELCEGTISSLFVETASGARLTPSLECGVLPGILRQTLLAERWAEAVLRPADLHSARRIFMGNALRGLIPVDLVTL